MKTNYEKLMKINYEKLLIFYLPFTTEKGHNDEGVVSFLCMEQSTGAIAYPRKARPPTAWVSWELGVSS